MQSILAVVNPAAGGGRCGRRAGAAIAELRQSGLTIDVVETRRSGEATEIVRREHALGRDGFIAVGGDGTGYEVVNGLFSPGPTQGNRPWLGFLPLGTGNSFLRDFTREGSLHAMDALRRGARRPCDVIRLEHGDGELYYINILSIGFVADVNGLRQRRFRRLGEFGYVAAVVTEVVGLAPRSFAIRLDGGAFDETPVTFYSFNNSKFTGGAMMMAPNADVADGKVDIIRVGALGRVELLRAFPKIFSGAHVRLPSVTEMRATVVEFDIRREVDVMVDGEALRVAPRRLEVLHHAIDVCV